MPCSATCNVNRDFLGILQHENKDTQGKQFCSKYFPAYCFINLLVNYLLHTALKFWKSGLYQILGQRLLWLLRWKNKMRPKVYQGYVLLLSVTKLSKFQIFVTNFAHSTTPINKVCLEPLWPSCGHGVKSTFLLGLPNGLKFWYTYGKWVTWR